uniref:Uncharacterized protein n=1 Tax=Candidozyma auris TaxID=498019 RepID=A0A0L0P401_CANAR
MSHRPPIFARQETLFFAARAMWQTKKWLDAWWEQMGWKILKPQRVVDKLQGLCSKPEKLAEKLVFAGRLRWRHADVKAVSGPEGCSLLAARCSLLARPGHFRQRQYEKAYRQIARSWPARRQRRLTSYAIYFGSL